MNQFAFDPGTGYVRQCFHYGADTEFTMSIEEKASSWISEGCIIGLQGFM